MYRLTDYGGMLRDRRRVDAYTRALASAIRPGAVFLDLGAGTGTFSILACRSGAARVYAVDPADIITVAEENARANGVADRIRFLQLPAAEIDLPEQVDVIVSDLAGALPLFEEHLSSVISVRDRFLKPDGVLIPRRDRLFCAPIASSALYETFVAGWRGLPGVDLRAAETMALQAAHALRVEPEQLAAEPQCWAEIDYATIRSPNVRAALEWPMPSATIVHGVALWFESTLHDGIEYSSGPWAQDSVHATMVLPLLEPVEIRDAFRFTIEATLAAGRYVITWQVAGGPRHSTFLSEPRSAASLADRASTPACSGPPQPGYAIAEQVLSRRVGGEVLLLDTASGVYHVLNETGTRVWELLQQGSAPDAIAAAVAMDYDVEPQRAAEDVAGVLAQLQEANLIRS